MKYRPFIREVASPPCKDERTSTDAAILPVGRKRRSTVVRLSKRLSPFSGSGYGGHPEERSDEGSRTCTRVSRVESGILRFAQDDEREPREARPARHFFLLVLRSVLLVLLTSAP